jgi:hypoxanthine phosphoribosyltransferase
MSTSSYRAEAGTLQGHLDIAKFITTPKGEIAGKVLLVDDLADSGHTLKAVMQHAQEQLFPHHRAAQRRDLDQGLVASLTPTTPSNSCPPTPGSTSRLRATTRCAQSS